MIYDVHEAMRAWRAERYAEHDAWVTWVEDWYQARRMHAWLLRAEGLTYREIGERLGLSRERVRSMIKRCGRETMRRMRPIRFTIIRVRDPGSD